MTPRPQGGKVNRSPYTQMTTRPAVQRAVRTTARAERAAERRFAITQWSSFMAARRPSNIARVVSVFLAGVMLAHPLAAQRAHRGTAYRVAARIALGGTGGWDLVTADSAAHRLFIAREDRVMVVDDATGGSLGTIAGIHGAQHVALAGKSGHGFVSSGGDGSVVMFDLATLKVLARTAAAPDADVLVYDPPSDRVFSFNGEARSITVIDPQSGAKVKTIGLTGSPGFGMADGEGHIIFNNASRSEVFELNTHAMKVTRHWRIAGCREPSGLALDTAHHRAFSVCANRRMAISDTRAGRLLMTMPIGSKPDGVVFDPATGNALSANGDGTITVVHEASPTSFRVVQTLATEPGARTIARDPASRRIYTVARTRGAQGTFTLLVIER